MARTHTAIDSPIGRLSLVAEDGCLVGVYMEQHMRRPKRDAFGDRVADGFEEVTRQLGDPALAQAVGAANADNPLCIIVPCHRVVGFDGRLVGYAGGLERKRFLLDLEQPTLFTMQVSA